MAGLAFVVYGHPAPQGSKRHVGRGVMVESSKAVKPWREAVKTAVLAALPVAWEPLDGPLAVRMIFTVARPTSAPKRLTVPDKMPDLSKLCRATEDAMTEAGVWVDDARVAEYDRLAKVWWGFDPEALPFPGAAVVVAPLVAGPLLSLELEETLRQVLAGERRRRELSDDAQAVLL